jgi:hypothetical protein
VYVTESRSSANQTGALGGDQSHADDDIVFVLVTLEGQLLALTLGDGQRISLTGRRCSESGPDGWVS